MNANIDVIWTMSSVCPWNCSLCCVDATHVKMDKGRINVISDNLEKVETIEHKRSGNIYDQAMTFRQQAGLELTLTQKLKIIDNLSDFIPKIDFSGGDPLVCNENIEVMKEAANKYGKKNLSVSTTGAGLAIVKPEILSECINKINFTYDNAVAEFDPYRPNDYNNQNLAKAIRFKDVGIKIKAQVPLSKRNSNKTALKLIYENLNKAGVDEMLVMRTFPVGRATLQNNHDAILTANEYSESISVLRELSSHYDYPKLRLQCALAMLESRDGSNPCDMHRYSFGLMPDGTLLTSVWAVGPTGKPLDDAFVLGNLHDSRLEEILKSEKSKIYERRRDENFGHCKIFTFLNSKREDKLSRLFDKADPMYIKEAQEVRL